jgi:hypothetical protein
VEATKPDYRSHLLALTAEQSRITRAWLKFVVGIESALAAGFAYLVLATPGSGLRSTLAFIICVAGALVGYWLIRTVRLYFQWKALFKALSTVATA